MTAHVDGLHHVTMMAGEARANDAFYREALGLRRVKATVNFDAPDVYHLYWGDEAGSAGTIMTSFPFGRAARGRRGAGEVSVTAFSVPADALSFWEERLAPLGPVARATAFGEERLTFEGPDGEGLALVGTNGDARTPWTRGSVGEQEAPRGFHSVTLALRDAAPMVDLLTLMGYREEAREGAVTRMRIAGNGADVVDLHADPAMPPAQQSAGSIHHVAFSVPDRAAQAAVREAVAGAGFQATPQIDRDYFYAIYFRTPGGILFEVATEEPGFTRDEALGSLGTALKLPTRHEPLRARLSRGLEPLDGLTL